MKVLFITEQFPYPLDNGGNIRTFHMLKALSSEHEVTLLANRPRGLREDDIGRVRSICSEIELIPDHSRFRLRTIGRLVSCLIAGKSVVLERHSAREAELAIQRLISRRSAKQPSIGKPDARSYFDAVHFNHLDAAAYERFVPRGVLRVLDEHNVVTNQVRTTLSIETRALRRWALRRESRVLPGIEQSLCNKMDLCITCSDVDRDALRTMGVKARIETVPNGVDLEFFNITGQLSRKHEVVFVGGLDYDPCEKGVLYFCENILPKLHRKYHELKFVVVGRNPSEGLKRMAARDGRIMLTGRVDDVRPYVRAAAAFVVPLLSGSGTRLKILDALALGTPVVTTSIGVEGIEAKSGVNLLVADDADGFADAVSRILESENLAKHLRQEGRSLVEQRYGWRSSCESLLRHYRNSKAGR